MAAGVGEEDGGVWGAGARNYDDQSWGVTRQGADQSGRGHHEKNNQGGIGAVVARHYDNLPEKGRESRQESRIYHMRSLFITYKLIDGWDVRLWFRQISMFAGASITGRSLC